MADNLITERHFKALADRVHKEFDNNNIANRGSFTLPAGGWVYDEAASVYVYTYGISNVTSDSRVDAVLDYASTELAAACGMYPITNTVEGAVVFTAKKVPADALTGQLYIIQEVAK